MPTPQVPHNNSQAASSALHCPPGKPSSLPAQKNYADKQLGESDEPSLASGKQPSAESLGIAKHAGGRPRIIPTEVVKSQVAGMAVDGFPVKAIARAMTLSQATVKGILKLPGTQVEITQRREALRSITVHKTGEVLEPMFDLLKASVDARDTKGVDKVARAIHAVEKISASASGETQKVQVEHTGSVDTGPVREQLIALIALVREEPSGYGVIDGTAHRLPPVK